HLHRHGLVHRDIKPSNIIYINGTPRLADVGLVTETLVPPSNVGTIHYMPNEGPGTVRADIFALGKVLYQAATGYTVDRFPVLPTCTVDSSEWPRFAALDRIFLKACAPDPGERYQTAGELQQALVSLQTTHALPEAQGAAPVPQPVELGTRRVAVLYKPKVEPDGHLLQLLRQRLLAQGIEVVFDRPTAFGLDWARELEETIRAVDAVVLLLSPASVQSEMLAYEIEMAHHTAQRNNGYPRCLPVRVQFKEQWPEALQPFLEPITPLSWDNAGDDERFVGELVRNLEMSHRAPVRPARPKIEPAGGVVDLTSRFYVVRPTDEDFRDAVRRWDSIVLVKGARQMGKTSLLARGLQQARQAGARVALSDFQKLSLQDLESAESFFLALGGLLVDQLGLDTLPDAHWDKKRSPNINFERFLRLKVLGDCARHLVWGLDEIDRLFTCPFGSEVFGLFRSWHNERALDPSGPWSRLTLAIAYATEAHLFITDVNQSPFNVGTRVDLEDFTFDQVMDLNDRYGTPIQSESEVRRLHALLGGQPYLVRRALDELTQNRLPFETLVAEADDDEGIFGDHLRRMMLMLVKDGDLTEVVRGMLRGQPCPNVASFHRLRSGGLMRGASISEARPRCEIYESYLKRHLR
ncbi:MAG TPA: AAA-like domain-containing protein, partial [Candidatus Saccharimonadales bacterium]|nr:AAA-like domain-containing protein [Candidatus Saccharimonadales bacterium]